MRTSQQGKDLIKKFESCKLDSYICPSGLWTIGTGHTQGVIKGMNITQEQADIFLASDLKTAENGVLMAVKKPILQNQFDALVSFAFNVGNGAFKSSTLLKFINQNPQDTRIAGEFKRWVYGSNKVALPGLIKRRREESDMYFQNLIS